MTQPAADGFLQAWLNSFTALSGWEIAATLLGMGYILFAIRQSVWAWPCAFFSTLIYTLLFWQGQLPLQAALNAYYLMMALYGFWLWRQPATPDAEARSGVTVHTKPWYFHLLYLACGFGVTFTLGGFLENGAHSRLPYLDAGVMVFSVMNTFLMARKVLENWLYWLVINSAAIVLYWQTGYYVTLVMFVLYFGLAIVGYREWRQAWQNSSNHSDPPRFHD
ncbi:MAG: nicotinamide riboside transporter PnuC [Hydrogenovibrio sp.]